MAAVKFHTATEYVANQLTITRGSPTDILSVGVYHDLNPNAIPDVLDFTTCTLVDGVDNPNDPLAEKGKVDVISLIGPKVGADLDLAAGDYQRWVLIQTADEDIIRKVDILEVL